jgi:hypothetical protein
MPFLMLMPGVLLHKRRWQVVIGLLLLPLSLFMNVLGIMVDFNSYLSEITQGDMSREAIYLWQPAYSPILAHIRRVDLHNIPVVSFHLSRSDIGFPEPAATFLSIGLVCLLLGALVGLWRALSSGRHRVGE